MRKILNNFFRLYIFLHTNSTCLQNYLLLIFYKIYLRMCYKLQMSNFKIKKIHLITLESFATFRFFLKKVKNLLFFSKKNKDFLFLKKFRFSQCFLLKNSPSFLELPPFHCYCNFSPLKLK